MINKTFFLEIDPIGKPRMTRADTWKKRKCVEDYWRYKDQLVAAAKEQGFVLGDNYTVAFTIAMPASWSKKKKDAMYDKPHQQKPDLDNLVKAINDCLRPKDDSGIYSTSETKYWGFEGCISIINNY